MSVGALKKRLRELSKQLQDIADEVEGLTTQVERLRPYFPHSYKPDESRYGIGEVRYAFRPKEPITAQQYWSRLAAQLQELIDGDEDSDHWLDRIESSDRSVILGRNENYGELIVRSEWVRNAIGPVPDFIFPEQFAYEPDPDSHEELGLEEFFNAAFPEAE